jgi:hypothetical protein
MVHLAATIATVFWFFLNGVLWYAKPSANVWLFGSLLLGAIWFYGFLRYVTYPKK